jgi:hypothetical protein
MRTETKQSGTIALLLEIASIGLASAHNLVEKLSPHSVPAAEKMRRIDRYLGEVIAHQQVIAELAVVRNAKAADRGTMSPFLRMSMNSFAVIRTTISSMSPSSSSSKSKSEESNESSIKHMAAVLNGIYTGSGANEGGKTPAKYQEACGRRRHTFRRQRRPIRGKIRPTGSPTTCS